MSMHIPRLQRLPIPAAIARGIAAATLLAPGLAFAGPTGGVVVGGSGTIGNPTPNGTVINQTSNSAIINWQQFNIGGNEYVQFIQPSSSSVVLNRVIGGSPSEILGALSANGRVFLINPNGVLFGAGARVDVGGLVASTLNIKDADFLSGRYVFSGGSGSGSGVVNAGTIKTADGGFVVLAGDYVKNTGVIQARLGQVVLASGAATTLDLDNSGLVSFQVDKATLAKKAGVDNAGQIIADGGRVIMTAKTARDLVGSAVNNSGLVRAEGIANHNGEIELTASGGDITDSGTLDASSANGPGGTVKIAGDRDIEIQSGAQILASGTKGGDISIVAERNLATRAGALIDAHGAGDHGGRVELSGHGNLTVRGTVSPGSGGTLLIDPTTITIANGSSGSGSAGGNQTVTETFVENQLQGNVNVQLVATSSITLNDLTSDGVLNGIAGGGGYGGSLLLGIGTINPASGQYVEGGGGSITFLNLNNTIATYGGLKIDAGSTSGQVNVGKLIGGSVTVKGVDGISAGSIHAANGGINLSAANGNIAATSLTSSANGANANLSSAIIVSAGGGIAIGSISSGASNGGSTGGNANASVQIDSNVANLGGSVAIGAITVGAASQLTGTATAAVDIVNHSSGASHVDIGLSGTIVAGAQGTSSSNAHVSVSNNNGGIADTAALSIQTLATGGTINDNITLGASNGGSISAGSLVTGGGSITVNATGSGANISLGQLMGLASYGGITSVSVVAAGSLALSGDVNAGSIRLGSGAGNLVLGALTASNGSIQVTDSAGSITTKSLQASAFNQGGSSVNASIGLYSAGAITVNGSVSTDASAFGSFGSANASVDLEANYYANGGGNLVVNGAIGTFAGTSGSSANSNAAVTLGANNGGDINLGSNGITTQVSGINVDAHVSLSTAGGHSITTGNLAVDRSALSVTTSGVGGNIAIGTVSGGSYGGITNLTLSATGGTLSTASFDLTAGSITLNAGAGALSFGSLAATAGGINITTSGTGGSVTLGEVSGGSTGGLTSLNVNAKGAVAIKSDVTAQSIRLNTSAGTIVTQGLTATNGGISLFDSASSISTGNLSASASVTNNSATASIGVYSAGAVSVGSVTTSAQAMGTYGSATATVDLEANYYASNGGDLSVGGPIGTSASTSVPGFGASSGVTLANGKGNIALGSNGITTLASGTTINGDILMTATGGAITTGDLSAQGSGIRATTNGTGGGNITLGTLSGGSGTLTTVNLNSAGTLSSASSDITANTISLAAAGGDLNFGNLTAGSGGISLTTSNGHLIKTGGLIANGGSINARSTGAGGDISLGVLGGGNLGLNAVTLNASGMLAIGNASLSAKSINIGAGAGTLNLGALTATNGSIQLTNTAGDIIVSGPLSASASVTNNSANATIGIYSGGAISVGSLTTNAQAMGTYGSANSSIDLEANYYASNGGALTIGGPVSSTAHTTVAGFSATADITLDNGHGALAAGSNTITALAIGSTISDNLRLVSNAGGTLTAGNLQTTNGSITVSSNGAGGDISIGTLSGGGSPGNQLKTVSLSSSGKLSTASTSITANSITISSATGDLSFAALAAVNGDVSVHDTAGNIVLGAVSGGSGTLHNLNVGSGGTLSINSDVTAQSFTLAAGGDLTAAKLTSTAGGISLSSSGGGIKTDNLSATSIVSNNSANASISAYAAKGITVGSVIANAQAMGTFGSATADITLQANYYGTTGGNLVIGGAVSTNAVTTVTNFSSDARVYLSNGHGNIDTGGNSITTAGSANGTGTFNGNVDLHSSGGGTISTGDITALNSVLNISSSGVGGNVSLGALSGGSGAGDQLTTLNISSSGSLTSASTSLTANDITLAANGGTLSFGSLAATSGNIHVTNGGGNVKLGALSGGGGILNALYITASGGLTIGGASTTAQQITLGAGTGVLKTGNLTATNGGISLTDTGSSIDVGNLSATQNGATGASADISAYAAAGIKVGSVTTHATVTGASGYADGRITLDANYYATGGGNLIIGGPIGANASSAGSGTGANASVYLYNGNGSINGGSNSITTLASGSSINGDITASTAKGGAISFGNLTATNGGIFITAGGTNGLGQGGNVSLGTLSGGSAMGDALGSVSLSATGSLDIGTTAVTANDITLSAGAGNLSFGALTTTNGNLRVSDTGGNISGGALTSNNGYIAVDAYSGGIVLGNLQATTLGATGATASIGVYSGAGIQVGSVTTDAEVSGATGSANGSVAFYANYHAQNGGALVFTGPIGTKVVSAGSGYSANGSVYLQNSKGAISGGSNGITTLASGSTFYSNIDLHSFVGGTIGVGDLTATNGAITVASSGAGGNVTLGALSGGAAPGNALTTVVLDASGSLSIANASLSAGSISLTAGAGDLGFGDLISTSGNVSVADTGGNIHGGNLTSTGGYIRVDAYSGNIVLGDLSATNIGSHGGNASIGVYSGGGLQVGQVSTDAESTGTNGSSSGDITLWANYHAKNGGSLIILGPVGSLAKGGNGTSYGNGDISLYNADGAIDATGVAIVANGSGATHNGSIVITASNGGDVTTGDLTATNDSIQVTSASGSRGNGNIVLGGLSGGALPGDALTLAYLVANGSLTVNGDITAPTVTLGASHGGISAGNITVTNDVFSVSDTGGSIVLGNVSATGYISLSDDGGDITTGNLSALNSTISLNTYSGTGNIAVGQLSGGPGPNDLLTGAFINALGSLSIGAVDAPTDITAQSISLSAGKGLLSAGNLTATDGTLALTNSGGDIKVGNLEADQSSDHNGATATIVASAAGGISVGSITTNALSGSSVDSGNTSVYGYIDLRANNPSYTQLGGNLVVNGDIHTNATNTGDGFASAGVFLFNGKGGISTQGITANATSASNNISGDIQVSATGGNASTGSLTVNDGEAITVSTSGSGDVSVGQLAAANGGELSIVSLVSAGGVNTNGTDITTGQLSLSAANGDIHAGNLTTTLYGIDVIDYGGAMTLGTLHSNGSVSLYDSRFLADGTTIGAGSAGITTGDLFSADNIFITSTGTNADGSGGNVKTGTLNNNTGTLGTLDIESSGGIDIGGASHAATISGVMTLKAGNGDITTGDLTGTYSSVTVSAVNGNILLGSVTADGPLSISNKGSSSLNGNIQTGNLADLSGNSVSVTTTAFGDIKVGTISGSSDGSLGMVKLAAAGALSTSSPGITAGSITLSAGNGNLDAHNLTSTNGGSALSITDSNGKITVGNVTARGNILIQDGVGGINAGNLAANQGAASITVSSTGSGANIKLGTLSGGTTDTPLSMVSLVSGGTLSSSSLDLTAGSITLSAGAGNLNFGNLDALGGAIALTDTGGNINVTSLKAGSDLSIAANGAVTVNGNLSLGNSGNGALSINAASVKTGDIANNSPLAGVGAANDMHITASTGDIQLGSVTTPGVGTVALFLTATNGAISTGDIQLEYVQAHAAHDVKLGQLTLFSLTPGSPTSSGAISDHGMVTALDVSVDSGFSATASTGISLGSVSAHGPIQLASGGAIGTGDLDSATGSVVVTDSAGNIDVGSVTASGLIQLGASNGHVKAGALTANSGSIDVSTSGTGGDISVGTVSGGDGTLNTVSFVASGGLGIASTDLTANTIVLSAGAGNLSAGNLMATGAGISISDTGGKLSLGNVTANGSITLTDSVGGISAGNLLANQGGASISVTSTGSGANVMLGSLSGGSADTPLSAVNLVSGGSLAAGITDISAGTIKLSAASGALSFGALTATSGDLSVVNSGGLVHTGALTATGGALTLSAHGALTAGAINAASVNATATGGNALFTSILSGGEVDLTVNGGNLNTGAITAGTLFTNLDTGNETVGAVKITGNNFFFQLGDHSGQSLNIDSLDFAAPGNVAFNYANANLSIGSVSVGGGFTATLTNGNLSAGNVSASAGDINLTATHGSLAFGSLHGTNIALSTGQALNVTGSNIVASGSFNLNSGGNTTIGNSSIDAGSTAAITSGGTLGISNSSVLAPTVTLNATGGISIGNNSAVGDPQQLGGLVAGSQLRAATPSSVSLTSGADIAIDKSRLDATQLSLNGHAIHLANGAALTGTNVVLTGSGAVDATGTTSSVNAGALSVRGASIDFTKARLTVGSGTATFGSDAALLAQIKAKDPALSPASAKPNASFSAAGGVALGQLSIAGGYLFIEAPSLQMPTSLSGNSNMFVDFQPSNATALLNVNLTQPISGVTTLVFGGSHQAGDIQIGDGTQSFALNNNLNLVFATQGQTLYPDAISSNGVVLVLGTSVARTPPVQDTDLPMTPDQYTVDEPQTGVLAYTGDPGDVNDPGVNEANKGRIDIKTSTQTLSCGIGGTQ